MNTQKSSRFEAFLSLGWYETFLKFIANFVAKSAELLLAAGLVVSSANFLTDGGVLGMGSTASNAWSWTQALAIDASLGISFYYVLQCLKQRDWVKFSLYSLLTLVLTLVAGIITDGDIFSHAMHTPINQAMTLLGIDVRLLSILRSVAVVGFVLMSRLRDVSFKEFTGPEDAVSAQVPSVRHSGPQMDARVPAQRSEAHFTVEEVILLLQSVRTNGTTVTEDPVGPAPSRLEQLIAPMASQKRQVPTPPADGTTMLVQRSARAPVPEEPPMRDPQLHSHMVPIEPQDPADHMPPVSVPYEKPSVSGGTEAHNQAPNNELIQMEREERLEHVYQELLAEGQKISGRTLAERAHIHRATCGGWLRARQRTHQAASSIHADQEVRTASSEPEGEKAEGSEEAIDEPDPS